MATPDVRVRLSAEGQKEIVDAFRKIQSEGRKAGGRNTKDFLGFNNVLREGTKLLGAFGIGLTAIGTVRGAQKAIGVLREWETELAEVRTVSNATDAEFAQIERRLLGLSSIIPKNTSLISKGYYETLSAGITQPADALYFLTRAAKAGVGGIADIDDTVKAGAAIMHGFGLEVKDTDRIFDALFTTVREGEVVLPQLAKGVGPAIPVFAQAGLSLEELLAAGATLTKAGFQPDTVFRNLRDAVVKIIAPAEQAKQVAADLGLEFNQDALQAKGLAKFLRDVQEATGGDSEAIRKLFPDVQGMVAVMSLGGNQAKEFARILDVEVNEKLGASQEAFEKMTATQEAQEQLLRNRLKAAWIELGHGIQEGLKGILAGVGTLIPPSFEEQTERLEKLQRQIERVDRRGKQLADTYEDLVRKSRNGEASQEDVTRAMRALAAEFPEVITQWNAQGEVIAINADNLRLYREELEKTLTLKATDLFQGQVKDAQELRKEIEELTDELNRLSDLDPGAKPSQNTRYLLSGFLGQNFIRTVEESRQALQVRLARARVELRANEAEIAQAVISAHLAPEILAFDALAKSIEKGLVPAEQFSKQLEKADYRLFHLFNTADPEELKRRFREVAQVLRTFDPLRFGDVVQGQGPEPPPKQEVAAELVVPPELRKAREDALRKEREDLAVFLNTTFGTSVTEGFVKSLQESEPSLHAFFTKLFRESQKEGFSVDSRVLEAQGRRFEADLLRIQEEVAAADEKLRAQGISDEERIAQLGRLRTALTNVARFDEVERQARLAIDQVMRARDVIEAQVDAGILTQEEGQKRILAIEKERIQNLRDLSAALLAAARATGDPEAIARAEEFAAALAGIGAGVRITTEQLKSVKQTLRESLIDGMVTFFDEASASADRWEKKLRSAIQGVIASIRRLLFQMLALKIVGAIPGLSGGGQVGGGERKASGGLIQGPGTETSDSIPARLSNFEYVVRASVVKQPGVLAHLEELNRDGERVLIQPRLRRPEIPHFAGGGLVGGGGGAAGTLGGEGRLVVEHSEDVILRVLASPEGVRIRQKSMAKARNGFQKAMGRV